MFLETKNILLQGKLGPKFKISLKYLTHITPFTFNRKYIFQFDRFVHVVGVIVNFNILGSQRSSQEMDNLRTPELFL